MVNGTCSVEGCDRPAGSRGMCNKHYLRWYRHGDPHHVWQPPVHDQCSVAGCDAVGDRAGMCGAHYARKWRGVPVDAPLVRHGRTDAERFWEKVNKAGPLPTYRPDLGPCWLWTGAPHSAGYGIFSVRLEVSRTAVFAHRWSYTELVGPIPDGLDLDHLCRVRLCVRPTHLEPVTRAENLRRGAEARRAG